MQLLHNVASIRYQNTTNCRAEPCHFKPTSLQSTSTECIDSFPTSFPKGTVVFSQNSNSKTSICENSVPTRIETYVIGGCTSGGQSLAEYGFMGAYFQFIDCNTLHVVTDPYNFGCDGGSGYTIKLTKNCSNGVALKCY